MPAFFTQSLKQQDFSAIPTLQSLEPRRMLAASTNSYTEQDLTSDGSLGTPHVDTHLLNPWGMVVTAHGIQIANSDSGTSTAYDAGGDTLGSTITVPGNPTGIVQNPSATSFLINGTTAANFIFATETGKIEAVGAAGGTTTVVSDQSNKPNVFKGLAVAAFKHNEFLYAANFTGNTINVFNSSFALTHVPGRFVDPNLPAGYGPFNVQNINGQLYVQYARHLHGTIEPGVGVGTGIVDVFGSDGNFVKRLAAGGKLDAPWGIAQAPATGFGAFSGDILVGNFGNGQINAFNPTTNKFDGTLANSSKQAISIDGLWGIEFGNGKAGTLPSALYFAAGIEGYNGGLYGRLLANAAVAATPPPSQNPTPPTSPSFPYSAPMSATFSDSPLDQLLNDAM